jgi:hypothetical protein
MKQPTSRILFDYWNDVRRGRLAPTRFEIEPSRIAPILSETFILERTSGPAYPFRLAGTRICEIVGQELRGTDFRSLAGEDIRTVTRALETVTHEGAVAVLELEAATPDERTVTLEAIVLPLTHPAKSVTRYLGAITAIDAPPWLGTQPLTPVGLATHHLIWPDGRPHAVLEAGLRQLPFAPELAAARMVRNNRRQFRILDGGRK